MAPSKASICSRVELKIVDLVLRGLFWHLRSLFLPPAPLLLESMLKGLYFTKGKPLRRIFWLTSLIHPSTYDKMTSALQAQIDDTVGVMRENIDKVLQRGESLDSL